MHWLIFKKKNKTRGIIVTFISISGLFDRQPEQADIQLKTNFTAIVIITYMRSGSSLTGDILQQTPGAFYVYEPLHALGHIFKKLPGTDLEYVNGTIRYRMVVER